MTDKMRFPHNPKDDIRFFPEGSWGHKNQGRSIQSNDDPEYPDCEARDALFEEMVEVLRLAQKLVGQVSVRDPSYLKYKVDVILAKIDALKQKG